MMDGKVASHGEAGILRAVIADDESLARDLLRRYVMDIEGLQLAAEASDGMELMKILKQEKVDLIFLDIEMPKLSGFEVLELLVDPPAVIFTTAYDRFAVRAFEADAVDYLLKPFSAERLKKAVDRVRDRLLQKGDTAAVPSGDDKRGDAVNSALEDRTQDTLQRIIVRDLDRIHFIALDRIIYMEAQDDYVKIVHEGGAVLKQGTMKYLEDRLPKDLFVRVHRSYIAAVTKMKALESGSGESMSCLLEGGVRVPVSRAGMSRLKAVLEDR